MSGLSYKSVKNLFEVYDSLGFNDELNILDNLVFEGEKMYIGCAIRKKNNHELRLLKL